MDPRTFGTAAMGVAACVCVRPALGVVANSSATLTLKFDHYRVNAGPFLDDPPAELLINHSMSPFAVAAGSKYGTGAFGGSSLATATGGYRKGGLITLTAHTHASASKPEGGATASADAWLAIAFTNSSDATISIGVLSQWQWSAFATGTDPLNESGWSMPTFTGVLDGPVDTQTAWYPAGATLGDQDGGGVSIVVPPWSTKGFSMSVRSASGVAATPAPGSAAVLGIGLWAATRRRRPSL